MSCVSNHLSVKGKKWIWIEVRFRISCWNYIRKHKFQLAQVTVIIVQKVALRVWLVSPMLCMIMVVYSQSWRETRAALGPSPRAWINYFRAPNLSKVLDDHRHSPSTQSIMYDPLHIFTKTRHRWYLNNLLLQRSNNTIHLDCKMLKLALYCKTIE